MMDIPYFRRAQEFSEGRAAIARKRAGTSRLEWNFLTLDGKYLLEKFLPLDSPPKSFENGLSSLSLDGKTMLVNWFGEFV